MSAPPPAPPGPGTWKDALLTSGSEALLGAVRNYIGPVRTPFDKRDLAGKLEAFLRRAETQESLIALLDGLDVRLVGTALLLGPAPEHLLKGLFEGELPLFDLGVRIANLYDRLILFRYQEGGKRLVAVNPLLAERLAQVALGADALFGPPKEGRGSGRAEGGGGSEEPADVAAGPPAPGRGEASSGAVCDAESALGFFLFLFHAQGAVRKGGGLTKKAVERAAALLPDLAAAPERLDALLDALTACGVLAFDGEERRPDRRSFEALLSLWGEDLPFFLAACLAAARRGQAGRAPAGGGSAREDSQAEAESVRFEESAADSRIEAEAALAAAALREPPGGPGFVFSRGGLERWLGIASLRSGPGLDSAGWVQALGALGIAAAGGGGLVLSLRPRGPAAAASPGRLVAEGAHALHLMPEASLEERLFVGCVARPVSFGTVWSFEVERDSVRRAFASGLDAKGIAARLELMSGAGLPQSLAFSLSAWEEEYRSLRLYRGVVLAADERLRAVIERSRALDGLVAEVLAPGVYFLSSPNPEAAAAALARAGLEASPRIAAAGGGAGAGAGAASEEPGLFDEARQGAPAGAFMSRVGELRALVSRPGGAFDPASRLGELRAALERALREGRRSAADGKEFAERIERRIILTERQIAEADPRSERLEAVGLDYLGKVRVIERALRSSGDRLELLYRLPGAEPVRALLRPVKLDKNEKGLVLEAEDLATGGPARIPLGAVSTVRRVRATLFGEDT